MGERGLLNSEDRVLMGGVGERGHTLLTVHKRRRFVAGRANGSDGERRGPWIASGGTAGGVRWARGVDRDGGSEDVQVLFLASLRTRRGRPCDGREQVGGLGVEEDRPRVLLSPLSRTRHQGSEEDRLLGPVAGGWR